LTLAFWVVDATFLSRDMWCRVRSREKSGPQFDVFAPRIWGRAPRNFLGAAFVNRHHFRATGEVRLRWCGWSFVYADEKKINYSGKIKYDGFAFSSQSSLAVVSIKHCQVAANWQDSQNIPILVNFGALCPTPSGRNFTVSCCIVLFPAKFHLVG